VEFIGERPCDRHGHPLNLTSSEGRRTVAEGLDVDFQFSRKPLPPQNPPYANYYEKLTTYVTILLGPAQALDPSVTPITHPVIPDHDESSVFEYYENASSRAGIGAIVEKLKLGPIAIVGLGGTGSYVLDLVAKTPVREIHLFDGDTFYQHNAFRSPGAASLDDLEAKRKKVDYFAERYAPMRRNIVAHPDYVTAGNVDELKKMDFVFVCMDDGRAKRVIIEALQHTDVPFIDVGMGLQQTSTSSLTGIVRVTASTSRTRDAALRHISFSDGGANDEYAENIQVADLNALNAALAVIRWKKIFGFYADIEFEQHAFYTFDDSNIIREGSLHEG
jgi:hypothetical protein